MSYQTSGGSVQSFHVVRRLFFQAAGLPYSDILPEQTIQQAFADNDAEFGQGEGAVYTPDLTLWVFLTQVLQTGVQRSCDAAVDRLRSLCLSLGISGPSGDSGAYCRARAKLPDNVLETLTVQVADELEARIPEAWLWHGRHVVNVDGTTVLAPDTPGNQKVWPQQPGQKPGLGFPILRLCALTSLATGAIRGLAFGPYEGKETGETALLRSMLDRLNAGDVLLGDSYFCSYFMIALLQERDVDIVFRQHQRRRTDFRQGKRLGNKDHIVRWRKPARPAWMDEETYNRLPDEITVRELASRVSIPGFRPSEIVLVTTMTDSRHYTKADVFQVFRGRWNAEIDFRSIKVHMNMEDLRGQSPEIVRKELWVHCLAYNLIRKTMAQAAVTHDQTVRTISFAGALQAVAGMMMQSATVNPNLFLDLAKNKLESIASRRVGHRPNRVEPRAIKRRPKSQKLMTKPREEARRELISGSSAA